MTHLSGWQAIAIDSLRIVTGPKSLHYFHI